MSSLPELEDNIPALRRYAWALTRDAADADDLVQDCLVRALDRAPSRTGGMGMRPWLFTIMHNLCVSRWRRMRSRRTVMVEDTDVDAAIPASQQQSAELRAVLRGLQRLPEAQRQIVLLVAVEGFEYREVAQILGVPVGTVMSRLSRARDTLRGAIDGREAMDGCGLDGRELDGRDGHGQDRPGQNRPVRPALRRVN